MSVLNASNPIDYASDLSKQTILEEIVGLQNKLNNITDDQEYRWTLFCLEILNQQFKEIEGTFAIDQIDLLNYYYKIWEL